MTNLKATCSSSFDERCHLAGTYEALFIRVYTLLHQTRLGNPIPFFPKISLSRAGGRIFSMPTTVFRPESLLPSTSSSFFRYNHGAGHRLSRLYRAQVNPRMTPSSTYIYKAVGDLLLLLDYSRA